MKGYKFSVDSILLAALIARSKSQIAIDLGTGCGVVSLILAYLKTCERIIALELQPTLAKLAKKNVKANKFEDIIEVIEGDIKNVFSMFSSRKFDLVFSNPPYIEYNKGHKSPLKERALARHEIACTLYDIIKAARYLVKPGGRICLVYPVSRFLEVIDILNVNNLTPYYLTFIHPKTKEEANLFFLEAQYRGKQRFKISPPLFIFNQDRKYTPELQRILKGDIQKV